MAKTSASKAINVNHPAYNLYSKKWQRCRDVILGQDAIYAGKDAYLSRLTDEEDSEYTARLLRTPFFNATARTTKIFIGMLFRKDPILDVPKKIEEYLEDVTMSGLSFKAFAKKVAKETLAVSRVGVLVDHPLQIQNEDGSTVTVAAAESLGVRPNMQLYKTERIINWDYGKVDNKTVLIQLRLKETQSYKLSEFENAELEVIRVLDLIDGSYRQRVFDAETEEQIGGDIYPVMNDKKLTFIPFYFIDPDGDDNGEISDPELLDLVEMNLKHFSVSADYEHGCHMTALPTPWATGVQTEFDGEGGAVKQTFHIGSTTAWVFSDPNAKVGFLEFTGSGLTTLENNLNRKEQQMAVLGAEALAGEKNGVEAYKTKALRSNGENSTLASVAIGVSEGLMKALVTFAEWADETGELKFEINRDFIPVSVDAQTMTAWLAAVQAGEMSSENFYNLLDRADLIVDEKTDYDKEQAKIEQQPPSPAVPKIDPVEKDKSKEPSKEPVA